MKIFFFSFLFSLSSFLFCTPLHAQTANVIQTLLQTDSVNYEQAVWFVMEAADHSLSPNLAFNYAVENKYIPQRAQIADTPNLKQVSLLLMRAFNIRGGILYSIFRNPHYAYRELVYKDIIQGRSNPRETVSGEDLLFLVNRILFYRETNPWTWPAVVIEENITREEEIILLAEEITAQLETLEIEDASVTITEEGIAITLSNIQFLANSAEIPENEMYVIGEIARILENIPARRIMVSGHTALAGTEQDRLRTSLERAQAVADYFIEQGTRTLDEIVVEGFGSQRPIADNNTQQGMAINRRVEILILEDQE
jgi:outer membrane protein OmpA-like peptidoglycan-associated protein